MKSPKHVFGLAAAVFLSAVAGFARGNTAILINPSSLPLTGSQNFNNAFGIDFNVNSPITITDMGVFDNGQNGLSTNGTQPITATIYSRTAQTAIPGASLGFGGNTGSDGTLTQGYRFKSLTVPIALPVGQYSIVTDFYSQSANPENFYNAGGGTNNTVVRDTGGGAISFVGTGRFISADNTFPTTIDSGTEPIRYDAGTFVFTPEPTSLGLVGLACVGLLARRGRARQ